LKAEQEKIEKQLKDFEDHLWKQGTAIPTSPTGNKAKKTKNSAIVRFRFSHRVDARQKILKEKSLLNLLPELF